MGRKSIELTTEQVDNLRQGLWYNYNKTGSLDFIDNVFEQSFSKRMPQVRGEIAEVVLEIYIHNFIKTHKNIICLKNLVLPTKNNRTTEIDIVVASPKKMVLFESKSYDGKKTIVKEGTMIYKKYCVDVFGQHQHHILKMNEIFKGAKVDNSQSGGYSIALFSYANGDIEDKREEEWKVKFPLVTKDNLTEYLESQLGGTEEIVWDINKIQKGFQYLEKQREELLKSHLKRLR